MVAVQIIFALVGCCFVSASAFPSLLRGNVLEADSLFDVDGESIKHEETFKYLAGSVDAGATAFKNALLTGGHHQPSRRQQLQQLRQQQLQPEGPQLQQQQQEQQPPEPQ
eukprot:GHVQ01007267.1.p2 GENE.GHVQ01007267.1~~GHVQ01007267.1.p2  ORF type:complete len:110 (+),score=23.45 GHVQ01007267.1:316-645(+)